MGKKKKKCCGKFKKKGKACGSCPLAAKGVVCMEDLKQCRDCKAVNKKKKKKAKALVAGGR